MLKMVLLSLFNRSFCTVSDQTLVSVSVFIFYRKVRIWYRVAEESLTKRLNTDMHETCLKIVKECRWDLQKSLTHIWISLGYKQTMFDCNDRVSWRVHGSEDEVIHMEDAKESAKIIPNHKLEIVELNFFY